MEKFNSLIYTSVKNSQGEKIGFGLFYGKDKEIDEEKLVTLSFSDAQKLFNKKTNMELSMSVFCHLLLQIINNSEINFKKTIYLVTDSPMIFDIISYINNGYLVSTPEKIVQIISVLKSKSIELKCSNDTSIIDVAKFKIITELRE